MEDARIQFFRDVENVEGKWKYIVASLSCDFIRQVYFGQTLIIRSHVTKVGNSSFHLEQEMIEKESGELVAKGKSVIVQFNFEKQKSEPLTEELKSRLEGYVLTN
jgi:acyl-CoA thioester hydrolase